MHNGIKPLQLQIHSFNSFLQQSEIKLFMSRVFESLSRGKFIYKKKMFRINNAIMEMKKVIIFEEIYWIENHKISTQKVVRISRIFRETGPGSGPDPDPDQNFCPGPGPGLPKMAGIPESGPGPGQSGETLI